MACVKTEEDPSGEENKQQEGCGLCHRREQRAAASILRDSMEAKGEEGDTDSSSRDRHTDPAVTDIENHLPTSCMSHKTLNHSKLNYILAWKVQEEKPGSKQSNETNYFSRQTKGFLHHGLPASRCCWCFLPAAVAAPLLCAPGR